MLPFIGRPTVLLLSLWLKDVMAILGVARVFPLVDWHTICLCGVHDEAGTTPVVYQLFAERIVGWFR